MNTKLGWILSGLVLAIDENYSMSLTTHVLKVNCQPISRNLDNTLKSLWELESMGVIDSEASVYEQLSSNVAFQGG